jgi:hypothetical protein
VQEAIHIVENILLADVFAVHFVCPFQDEIGNAIPRMNSFSVDSSNLVEPCQGGGTLSGWWNPVRVVEPCQGGRTLSGWLNPVRVVEPCQGGGTLSGWWNPVRVVEPCQGGVAPSGWMAPV